MKQFVRIALVGPLGIGKTTAIRSVCGASTVDCDVPNLDTAAHTKPTTTVGADYGEIDIGGDVLFQLYGCPGQERFGFVRDWVLENAIGACVMVDVNEPKAHIDALRLLEEIDNSSSRPMPIILSTRLASEARLDEFARLVEGQRAGVIPIIQVDVRDARQVLEVFEIMVAMLSIEEETT